MCLKKLKSDSFHNLENEIYVKVLQKQEQTLKNGTFSKQHISYIINWSNKLQLISRNNSQFIACK